MGAPAYLSRGRLLHVIICANARVQRGQPVRHQSRNKARTREVDRDHARRARQHRGQMKLGGVLKLPRWREGIAVLADGKYLEAPLRCG